MPDYETTLSKQEILCCSLKTLKKQLTEAKATAAAKQGASAEGEQPLEWGRILTGEDFERIRCCAHFTDCSGDVLFQAASACIICKEQNQQQSCA